jgi:ArsR family transcriptional regulator
MRGWFTAAGLELDRIERLEGGELTVILWRGAKPASVGRERAAA